MSAPGKGYWIDNIVKQVTNHDYHQTNDIGNIGVYSPSGGKPQRYVLVPDGGNVFTLPVALSQANVQVFWNGLLQVDTDYEISGTQLTLTGFVPQLGDSLVVFG